MAVEVSKKAPFSAGEHLISPSHHDEKLHFSVSLARLIELGVDHSMGTPVRKFIMTKKTDILQNKRDLKSDCTTPSLDSNYDNITTISVKEDSSDDSEIEKGSPEKVMVKESVTSYLENRPDSSLPVKKRFHSKYFTKSSDVQCGKDFGKLAVHLTNTQHNDKGEQIRKRKIEDNSCDILQASSDSLSLHHHCTECKSPRFSLIHSTTSSVPKLYSHGIDKLLSTEDIGHQQNENVVRSSPVSSASSMVPERDTSAGNPVELPVGEIGPEEGQRLTELQPVNSVHSKQYAENVPTVPDPTHHMYQPTDTIVSSHLNVLDYHILRSLQNIESHKYVPHNNKVCKSLSMSKRNYFKYSDLVELIIEKRLDAVNCKGKKVKPLDEAVVRSADDSGSSDEDISIGKMLPPPPPRDDLSLSDANSIVVRQSLLQAVDTLSADSDEQTTGRFYWSKKITHPQPLPQLDEVARRNLCAFVPGRLRSTNKHIPDSDVIDLVD